ncbi:MAG: chemotaxis protein CheW [Candidatus Eisenbacteria bacterium]|uniref:Chemotaxis protein CheW n=1 Tax=Eiseniibacteriota bacterium TaxID=2212470 RepID=A0A956NAZ3_UNCEI|nr:chemotaxis protein CheW [Candidatus Eisenbacteria bacterium]
MKQVLTFEVRGKAFCLPVGIVDEIVPLSAVVEIPTHRAHLRGGVNVRSSVLPLFDVRSMVGDPGLLAERQELVAALSHREQEHIDWLEALESAVRDGKPFRKATDPTQCAFGKWFYSFHTADESLRRLLQKLEEPHKEIHGLASIALSLAREGKSDEGLARIESARANVLAKLLALLGEFKSVLVNDLRELGLLLRCPDGSRYAIAVDSVENIRDLNTDRFQESRDNVHAIPVVSRVWANEQETILELDIDYLGALGDSTNLPSVDVDGDSKILTSAR